MNKLKFKIPKFEDPSFFDEVFAPRNIIGAIVATVVVLCLTTLMGWVQMSVPSWADVVMAAAAIAALGYAFVQVRSSREDVREATAKSIRNEYLLKAIDHPAFANPDSTKLDFDKREYGGDREEFDDYTWFVSHMLLHCDELLRLRSSADDWKWEKIVENNISYHWDYIKSPAFRETRAVLSLRLRNKLKEMDRKIKQRGRARVGAALKSAAVHCRFRRWPHRRLMTCWRKLLSVRLFSGGMSWRESFNPSSMYPVTTLTALIQLPRRVRNREYFSVGRLGRVGNTESSMPSACLTPSMR